VAAPIAGRLADRYPAAVLSGWGLLALSVGLAFLAWSPGAGTEFDLIAPLALCGTGFAFFQAPNNRTLMASAPRPRSGAAAGMLSTARSLGHIAGAAVVAVFFGMQGEAGARTALLAAAGVTTIAALLSFSRLWITRH